MAAVKTIRSRTVALPAANIDTDQIIPARFTVWEPGTTSIFTPCASL